MCKIKILVTTCLLISFNSKINAQSGWIDCSITQLVDLCSVDFINDNTGYVLDISGSILKTTNAGLNWSEICHLGYLFKNIEFINEQTGFICGDINNGILKTTNGGYNWQTIALFNRCLHEIEFVNNETGYSVGEGGRVLKTTNEGNYWAQLLYNLGENYNSVHCLNESVIFVSGSEILKSSNGGNNWVNITPQSNLPFRNLYFVNTNTGFVLGSSEIFKTTNSGISWTIILGGALYYGVYFTDINTGYMSGFGKIVKTVNGGLNWQVQINNAGNYLLDFFFTNVSTGYCVGSRTILKTTNGGEPIGINPISNEIPQIFSLFQNFPNPFNPSTKIKFNIPLSRGVSEGWGVLVRLVIYDALGREVAVLVNEELKPGSYEVGFDGSNYPSGVYFYRLLAGGYSETKKMILIK